MDKGSGAFSQPSSLNVLVAGKSGTSKSILINGIFGKAVVKERHGVVNATRSSTFELYSNAMDGVLINVWVSSQLQDGTVADELDYLNNLKDQCSDVDLVLYCIKMTETRFSPGNPDDLAITKITKTLGHKIWNKTIFILTYANVAAQMNFRSQNFDNKAKHLFEQSILQWKNVLTTTVSRAARMPESNFNIKVVPAGHYNEPHLPDREYWLSVLWYECSRVLQGSAARKAFHQINSSRFSEKREIEDDVFQREIADQPIVIVNAPSKLLRIVKIAGIACCIGFILGYMICSAVEEFLDLKLAVLSVGTGWFPSLYTLY